MAFSIDYQGPARGKAFFTVRRQSDEAYWSVQAGGWAVGPVLNVLPEQGPGHFSFWMKATAKEEVYDIRLFSARPAGATLIRAYTCDSQGKPAQPKGTPVNATFVGGTLHVDGQPQTPEAVLEALSSNKITKYTAVRWAPSQICTCNCPGWTTNVKHKGKPVTARSCKHTKIVATMAAGVVPPSSNLPPAPSPVVGHAGRAGRGIELD